MWGGTNRIGFDSLDSLSSDWLEFHCTFFLVPWSPSHFLKKLVKTWDVGDHRTEVKYQILKFCALHWIGWYTVTHGQRSAIEGAIWYIRWYMTTWLGMQADMQVSIFMMSHHFKHKNPLSAESIKYWLKFATFLHNYKIFHEFYL